MKNPFSFTYKHPTPNQERHTIVLIVYNLLCVVDTAVFLATLTFVTSNFGAQFLFSDAVTEYTEGK